MMKIRNAYPAGPLYNQKCSTRNEELNAVTADGNDAVNMTVEQSTWSNLPGSFSLTLLQMTSNQPLTLICESKRRSNQSLSRQKVVFSL